MLIPLIKLLSTRHRKIKLVLKASYNKHTPLGIISIITHPQKYQHRATETHRNKALNRTSNTAYSENLIYTLVEKIILSEHWWWDTCIQEHPYMIIIISIYVLCIIYQFWSATVQIIKDQYSLILHQAYCCLVSYSVILSQLPFKTLIMSYKNCMKL